MRPSTVASSKVPKPRALMSTSPETAPPIMSASSGAVAGRVTRDCSVQRGKSGARSRVPLATRRPPWTSAVARRNSKACPSKRYSRTAKFSKGSARRLMDGVGR